MYSRGVKRCDVAIIGAGPAGIAAAIQLARQGLRPHILERGEPGGLLRNANLVENYPGFPGGISGPALAALFRRQLSDAGIQITAEEVTGLDHDGDVFEIETAWESYRSTAAIVASGTAPMESKSVPIPSDAADRILYEVCPIANVAGKRIAIVGAGDAAFDYALNLAKRNEVTILSRGKETKCLPLLKERARGTAAISYMENMEVVKISRTQGQGEGDNVLAIECRGAGAILADYLLFAIGREPRLSFISEGFAGRSRELEAAGLLHFAGDVKNGNLRQTAIATGDGIKAAMRIAQALA
ncbi:MAG: NAD(P)/FAD-dependent oxidoreductase [Pseudomonadota bacterium]